ncbi:MAG TPA: Ig-like domain-containing protein, partial [Terracidiphilus sp.]|nr:Ig-like domain-containing protein [Terracidiphilus sp.]
GTFTVSLGNGYTETAAVVWQSPPTQGSAVTLSSSQNPSAYGEQVTFTVAVPAGATGTITFYDGPTAISSGEPISDGSATYSTSAMAAGSHTITAAYSGDSNYAAATSDPLTQTVNRATPTVTSWPTASSITYGQTLASSTLSGGSASVPGSFAFTSPATVPPVGTSSQSVTFTPTDTASYNTVTGTVSVTVNGKTTPTILLTASSTSVRSRTNVIFTASLPVTATGSVIFYDGTTVLGESTLLSGSASFATRKLPIGLNSITASYSGDANYTAAISNPVIVSVSGKSH